MKRLSVFLMVILALVLFAGIAQAAIMEGMDPMSQTLFLGSGIIGSLFLLGAIGMAISANTPRAFEIGEFNEFPVYADTNIYEGAAVGDPGTGYLRGLVAGDLFRGFAEKQADNTDKHDGISDGSAGDKKVLVRYRGRIKLAVSGLAVTDVGKDVFASADGTFTFTAELNTWIGKVHRYVSSGVGIVEFDATPVRAGVTEFSRSLLTGVAPLGINSASTTQRYPLGTIMRKPDGREFVYAKAGATLNTDMGAKSYNTQHIAFTTIAADAVIGATSILLDVQATDGVLQNGAIALNELAGGYVVVFPHSSNTFVRGILGNTAVTAGAHEITLTLDDPIPVALVADTSSAEAMASPYLDVRNGTGATSSIVGIATVPATVGQYFWLQTKGINWLAPQTSVSVGNNHREVVFRHDGSIDDHDYNDANVSQGQHAGYVVQNARDASQGAPFVMFDI